VQGKLPGIEDCVKETADGRFVVNHQDAGEIGWFLVRHTLLLFSWREPGHW
jgi:hypothetical protein